MVAYSWSPPIYDEGQRVRFWWREGIEREGVVGSITTYYDRHGSAWHSYSIGRRALSNRYTWSYKREQDIVGLAPALSGAEQAR